MKLKVPFEAVAAIPRAFVDAHLPAGVNCESAVGKQVRRVRENHVNRVLRHLGEDIQAVGVKKFEPRFFVVGGLHMNDCIVPNESAQGEELVLRIVRR